MGDVTGVQFTAIDGDRSSTAVGQRVFAAAAGPADAELAARIAAERDWYGTYHHHARDLEQAQVRNAGSVAAVAEAGLASLRDHVEFVRDGTSFPLAKARELAPARELATAEVVGTGPRVTDAAIPYHGQLLTGSSLDRQLADWVDRDVIEPTAATAVRRVMASPDWLDLGDLTVVVMGGASEMGPLEWLTQWGATTAIIDLPDPKLWRTILDRVRVGAGRALVPTSGAGGELEERAGADLLQDLPAVWQWVDALDGPFVMGNYVYAHGSINVQVSMAVDAVVEGVLARDDGSSVGVLATPTDVYAVPEDAVRASQDRWQQRSRSRRLLGQLTGERVFAPNYPAAAGDGRRIVDSQITQQGCNYSLAKRLHRWRALAAREAGTRSSINVAPATRTRSVTDNRVLKAAYAAAAAYDIEVFEPDTARALMALLLVHDLRSPDAAADPATDLDHPLALLGDAACHGGLWRTPYAPGSVLPLAAVRGLVRPSTWR